MTTNEFAQEVAMPIPSHWVKKIEQAINEAIKPKGLHVNDGKARIDASILNALLRYMQEQSDVATRTILADSSKHLKEWIEDSKADSGRKSAWPNSNDVGRIGDMHQSAHMRVSLDGDSDVIVSVWDDKGGATVEFCCQGSGGGKSPRTREALIALMRAIEIDNESVPNRDWWAQRNGEQPQEASKAEEVATAIEFDRNISLSALQAIIDHSCAANNIDAAKMKLIAVDAMCAQQPQPAEPDHVARELAAAHSQNSEAIARGWATGSPLDAHRQPENLFLQDDEPIAQPAQDSRGEE